jgi:ribosomal protein L29
MAEKKMTVKEIDKKIVDLKIELLRSPTKKASIKREIARLLTMRNVNSSQSIADAKDSGNKAPNGVPRAQTASAKEDKLGKTKLEDAKK